MSDATVAALKEAGTDSVIRLEAVSVRYTVPQVRIASFKEYTIRRLQSRSAHREVWALKDVTVDIGEGEVFGIIGQNGAGKSTLLKVIARVISPTQGRVWVKGNVHLKQ